MAAGEPMHKFLDFLLLSMDARDAGDLLGTLMYAIDAQDVADAIDPVLVKLADCNFERVREAIDEHWSRAAGGPVRPSRDLDEMDARATTLDQADDCTARARARHDLVTEEVRARDDADPSGNSSHGALSKLPPCPTGPNQHCGD